MGFILDKWPKLDVATDHSSRWSCVHHPIYFEGVRKDVRIINFLSADPLPITVVTTTGTLPTDLIVGSEVYFQDNDGTKTGTSTVTSIVGSIVYLTKNTTFNFTNGYMNLTSRLNYSVEMEIKAVDDAGNYFSVGKIDGKPTPAGRIKFNVNGMLKKILNFDDRFQYDVINKRFKELGGRFNVKTRELWKGHEESFRPLTRGNTFFWINGTKQIQDQFNFNAGELVTFRGGSVLAKFASDFERPTYFKGYPFSLTFIYSENLAGRQITRNEERFGINGNSLSTNSANLDQSQNSSVNRLKIAEGYSSTVDNIEVWLEDAGTALIGYVGGGFVATGFTKLLAEELPNEETE